MSKYFKFLFLAILAVTLMASSALAGTLSVNHSAINTPYTISTEVMGANRDILLDAAGAAVNGALLYIPSQDVTTSTLLQLSFTGAAFNGSQILVCDGANNRHIGTATPTAGSTSQTFVIGTLATAGSNIYFTSAANCGGAASNRLSLRATSPSSSGDKTATIKALVSGVETDSAGAQNVIRVRNEYAVTLGSANHTVDYLGTPGNGTRFTGNVLYASVNAAANILRTVNNFNTNNGAINAGLTVSSVINLSDTANWQGLTKVFLGAGPGAGGTFNGTCTDNAGGNLVGTGSLNGTVSLTVPTGGFNGANNADLVVCLVASGNSSLSIPRTISASFDINVTGTGANDPAASSTTTITTWDTNAYQGLIPWSVNSSTVPTYCLINNNDTSRTATVILDVLSSEDSVTVNSSTLGTVAAKTSKLVTFTADSAQIDGGTAVSLSTLGASKRYAPKLTVTTNPNSVSVTCVQTDPVTGGKRTVPVLSNSGWAQ